MKVAPDNRSHRKHCELDCEEGEPCKPVKLAEKFQVKLAPLDKAVGVEDEEESEADVEVERDIGHGHQTPPHLRQKVKLKNSFCPDQEENPARKKSVGLGSIVGSIVASIVARSSCFVESLLTNIRTHQPNSGRDADKASNTCIENIISPFLVWTFSKVSSLIPNWSVSPDKVKQRAML